MTAVRDAGNGSGRRWRRGLCILSVALNLLVAGAVTGHLVAAWGPGFMARGPDMSLGPIVRAFQPEDRRWLMRELRDVRGQFPGDGAARDMAAQALIAAVGADPFDPAAVGLAFDAMRAGAEEFEEAVTTAIVARITGMDAAGRAALAERLGRELRAGGPGRR
ncbi:MAG: periplasmic heavy metal sensor [Rubellimicrobium sp.]|nr:periplasmic heavy metal sensor [Rubellimicrobium sp.]